MKMIINERQQLPSRGPNLLQIRHEILATLILGLLRQHLRITNDLVQRRPQVVDQARGQRMPGRFAGGI